MKKEKTIISIVTISLIMALTYMIIGNPIVIVNNQKLQREIIAVNSDYVELNEIVPFEWDTVYTFEPYTSKCNWQVLLQYFRQIKVQFLSAYLLRTYEV